MRLQQQVEALAHGYTRKGGKGNRRQQAARMVAFAAHAEALGATDIGQLGRKQVVDYWRAVRAQGLSERTMYAHWLALRELWRLAGKPGDPPPPVGRRPSGGIGGAAPDVQPLVAHSARR